MADLYLPIQDDVTKLKGSTVSRNWQLFFQKLIQALGVVGPFATTTTSMAFNRTEARDFPSGLIDLVPAQGNGTLIRPTFGAIVVSSTVAFTNIDAAAWIGLEISGNAMLSYVPNDAAITNGSKTRVTDLFGNTDGRVVPLVPFMDTEGVDFWGPIPQAGSLAALANQPLQFHFDNGGSGPLTGGAADATVTVMVQYLTLQV